MTHGDGKREAVPKGPYSQVLLGSQALYVDVLLAGIGLDSIATLCQRTEHSQGVNPGSQQRPVHNMN